MLFNEIRKEEDENLFVGLKHIKRILKKDGSGSQLFVLMHGWKHSAEDLGSVGRNILEDSQFQEATVVIPELNIGLWTKSKTTLLMVVWLSKQRVKSTTCNICPKSN